VPPASADVLIVSTDGATTMEVGADAVCTGLPESFTLTVKLNVPLDVGIPEITPVDSAIDRPLGNWPDETDHVYGPVPPVALTELLYDWFTVPLARMAERTTNVGAATDNVNVALADCLGELVSVTVTPNVKFPLAAGVPEMTPVEAARETPAGSWPELMLHV
jgi:hypothetical protein